MRKLTLTFVILSAFFALIFNRPSFAKEQTFPVFVTITNFGSYYTYEFTDTLFVDEVGIKFNDKLTIITSTNRSIVMTDFNFTSTVLSPLSGWYATEETIAPDIKIKAATEIIFVYLGNAYRVLLPVIKR